MAFVGNGASLRSKSNIYVAPGVVSSTCPGIDDSSKRLVMELDDGESGCFIGGESCNFSCEEFSDTEMCVSEDSILMPSTSPTQEPIEPSPCSSDPSVIGYSTINGINNDQEEEMERIMAGGAPKAGYIFTLCPNTEFNIADATPLRVLLSNSSFVCGNSGSNDDGCVLIGGTVQVTTQDYLVETTTFIGLTFSGFSEAAIIATTSASSISFFDVMWQVRNSYIVISCNFHKYVSVLNLSSFFFSSYETT